MQLIFYRVSFGNSTVETLIYESDGSGKLDKVLSKHKEPLSHDPNLNQGHAKGDSILHNKSLPTANHPPENWDRVTTTEIANDVSTPNGYVYFSYQGNLASNHEKTVKTAVS